MLSQPPETVNVSVKRVQGVWSYDFLNNTCTAGRRVRPWWVSMLHTFWQRWGKMEGECRKSTRGHCVPLFPSEYRERFIVVLATSQVCYSLGVIPRGQRRSSKAFAEVLGCCEKEINTTL